jgi:phosphonoacetaldehyde hydrolase
MQLKGIIFDWAGTVVDFGCLCPIVAFQSAFREKGVAVTPENIQQFMGIHKRDHIVALLALPEVLAAWHGVHGGSPKVHDVDELYRSAESRMLETVAASADLVPGLEAALTYARHRGLRIGSTTGYTTPLMEILAPAASEHGYAPEFWVAADQVPQGRPWPWMIFKNMAFLKICPPATVVKVGDTIADVAEASNAGVWSVAVVESSSLVGLRKVELGSLPDKERHRVIQRATRKLVEAGAHFVINTLSELAGALDQIEHRVANGQTPPRLGHHGSRSLPPIVNGITLPYAEKSD